MFCKLGKVIRNRPKTVLGLALFVLLAGGAGFYAFALHQWQAAQEAVRKGRPAEARLGLCLFLWPRSSEVHLLAARVARLTGDYPAADSHLKSCMRLQSGASADTQLEYLLMRAQTGEEDEVANALFTLVDKKHPESTMIMESMARVYMHQHRYGLAYECLNRWIKEAPNSSKPLFWRGWVLERMKQHKEAMSDYHRALELDPELAPARLRIAEILLEEKQPLEALEHLERLQKQSSDPAIGARLGQCLFLQGKGDQARKYLEEAEKKLPNDSALLIHLAKLDIQEGRAAKAEQWLRRALKVDPSDPEALFNLVTSLQLQGKRQEATAALDQYKERKNILERANRLLQEEAKHPSKEPGPAFQIGTLLISMGHERLGVYWLDQALVRDPGHLETHKALAEYFERKGEPEKAVPHRKRVKSKSPQKQGAGAGN